MFAAAFLERPIHRSHNSFLRGFCQGCFASNASWLDNHRLEVALLFRSRILVKSVYLIINSICMLAFSPFCGWGCCQKSAYVNVNVAAVSEQDPASEPAQKKRKRGKERFEAELTCNDKFKKPVHHGKALRSNVNIKKRTWLDIESDTNECSHLHRNTSHPNSYY